MVQAGRQAAFTNAISMGVLTSRLSWVLVDRSKASIEIAFVNAAWRPACTMGSKICLGLCHIYCSALALSQILTSKVLLQGFLVKAVEARKKHDQAFRDHC